MRLILLLIIYIASFCKVHSQHYQQQEWAKKISFSDSRFTKMISDESSTASSIDTLLQQAIKAANGTFPLSELTHIVDICAASCNTSPAVASSLTNWLREDCPIYDNRSPTESNQFRAFLLATLNRFPDNEEIYKYVKSELLFADHSINIAAAAATARNFRDKAAELVPLMEPFLSSSFPDEWVDITTPELNYPIAHPTKARYEIIQTLAAYGMAAYRSVSLLDKIAECKSCGSYGYDSVLYNKALDASEHIRNVTPECCRKEETTPLNTQQAALILINKQDRNLPFTNSLQLSDEEGNELKFADLTGKPFVLTFFYTQCTNASKCVSTVHRLGELQRECVRNNIADQTGIYGMTYDPDFDSPAILKKYGELYGVKFNKNARFLKTVDNTSGLLLTNQLHLRVNYGAGTVNQHGIQLFIFDKKGRLAAVCDNDSWSVKDVNNCLSSLLKE